ncbi:MAG TPA: hypothetical protein VNM72_03080 [Blastocatellia bacterium]|nr:hypothetical protein [Blastocatellia bacterium]
MPTELIALGSLSSVSHRGVGSSRDGKVLSQVTTKTATRATSNGFALVVVYNNKYNNK